jgi:hypothetical protein
MNQLEAQKPFVLIEPMQRHINQGKAKIVEFKNNFEAVDYFKKWCIENHYTEEKTAFHAGGIGHDYLIECFLNY